MRFQLCARFAVMGCLVAAVLAFVPAVADACPTCKDALAENDPQHQQVVKGYFYSILFMMSMPFVVLGAFGSLAYFSIRRSHQDADGAADDPPHGS